MLARANTYHLLRKSFIAQEFFICECFQKGQELCFFSCANWNTKRTVGLSQEWVKGGRIFYPLGVVIQYRFQCFELSVVHVWPGYFDISERGYFELTDILRQGAYFKATLIQGEIR